MDIDRQVAYWRQGSEEDLAVARELLANRRIRHGLFFPHLSLEKMLKARLCLMTRNLAPKIHHLAVLAQRSGVRLSDPVWKFLEEMDQFNLAGRYPEIATPMPSVRQARLLLSRTEEVLRCLRDR